MQVYLAVHANAGRALIVRKKYTSQWHDGHTVRQWTVNQAGQWALPGGGVNDGEEIQAAALREFQEEAGIILSVTKASSFSVLLQDAQYALVQYEVSGDVLNALQIRVQANVVAAPGGLQPAGDVRDWEFDVAQIVPNPDAFLGVRQQVPLAYADAVQAAPLWSQKIDWYAAMAVELAKI
jgi:8-oxo-dGTP pyrophosphatase MutT (NUDIX family)